MTKKLSADDFFSGLFAALAIKGWNRISIRDEQFDRALDSVFRMLTKLSKAQNLDLRFRIRLHPLHGDSSTVRDAISHAAQRDLISLDNPEFQDIRLKLGKTDAKSVLQGVPGKSQLFFKLAEEFTRHYTPGA